MKSLIITGLLFLSVGLSAGFFYTQAEDDKYWNCYIAGNHICGMAAPWHGFPNLFWEE